MEQAEYAKKITIASIGFDKKVLKDMVAKDPKDQEIAFYLALITNKKLEPNRLDSTRVNYRFIGQFEVKNLVTGETHLASEIFVPGMAESYLLAAKEGAGDGAVRTAFTIGVMADKSENSAMGYKFTFKPFVDRKESDPFKDLRSLLPAPAKKK